MNDILKKRFLNILKNFKNSEMNQVKLAEIADFTNDLINFCSDILLEITDDKELNVYEQEENKAQFQTIINIVQNFYQKYFGIACSNIAIKNKLKIATADESKIYASYFITLLEELENYIKHN